MKINCRSILFKLGLSLIAVSLLASTIRYYAIETFREGSSRSLLVPAGQMLEPEKRKFTFSAVSDTGAHNAPIERILRQIRHSKSEFVLYLGDLVRYRNEGHFRWITSELSEKLKRLHFYAVPGNHEITRKDGKVDRSLYNAVFGPSYYWFSYGNTLFIALDSSESKIDNKQFEWLGNTLKHIRPLYKHCIVFTHVPPINPERPGYKVLDDYSRNRLAKLLPQGNVTLLLAGHVHNFQESTFVGIPFYTLPSSGQEIRSEIQKFGYVDVKINNDKIEKVKPRYVHGNDDVEFFESFASSILVKESIHTFAVWTLCAGLLFLLAAAVLKLKKKG